MALSDQLTDLAHRTKELESTASAAEAQDKAKLEKEQQKLHTDMENQAKKIQSTAKDAKTQAGAWWADMAANVERQRNDLHAKIAAQKAERKVDKAMRHADDAESYAVDMIQVANYVIDAAEYAVADAVLARSQADDMVAAG